MARIFIDGFESGNGNLWVLGNSAAVVGFPPSGFTGSYYLTTSVGAVDAAIMTLPSNKSEIYISFKYQCSQGVSGYSNSVMVFIDSNATYMAGLYRYQNTTLLSARTGTGTGTVLQTGTKGIALNTTYLIEIHYKPLNSGGIFQVKVDGEMEIDYSGGDTTAGLESITRIGITWVNLQNYSYAKIDDFVVDDANWIGNTKIQALVPTGAGATTGWTPSTGSNYAAVDEIPVSDIDYIKTSSNQIDTYQMSDLVGSIASIKSVAVQTRNWREGNGSYDRAQHVVRPASTDRLSASKTTIFPISPASFQSIWELNPEDSAAWEEADINGMEAGIKAVTA